jgi:hypothetical protein
MIKSATTRGINIINKLGIDVCHEIYLISWALQANQRAGRSARKIACFASRKSGVQIPAGPPFHIPRKISFNFD